MNALTPGDAEAMPVALGRDIAPERLIASADAALYAAKGAGRNCVSALPLEDAADPSTAPRPCARRRVAALSDRAERASLTASLRGRPAETI